MKNMRVEAAAMRIMAVLINQEAAITITVTPQASLITITSQVEVVTVEATVYRVKVLEEAAVEEVTTVVVIMEEAAAAAEAEVIAVVARLLLIPISIAILVMAVQPGWDMVAHHSTGMSSNTHILEALL
jgi:hypothetical protein